MKKNKLIKAMKLLFRVILIAIILVTGNNTVFGADNTNLGAFESSQLVKGTEKLLGSIVDWITGIGITVCIGFFIYYVILLNTSDEGDRRRNIKNVKTTLIAVILITTGAGIINLLQSIYTGG